MSSDAPRDRGLKRVSILTRWTAAGAAALSGVFTVVVARPHLPKLLPRTPASTDDSGNATANQPSTDPNAGVTQDPGLQPPDQAPVPAPYVPQVRSGGS